MNKPLAALAFLLLALLFAPAAGAAQTDPNMLSTYGFPALSSKNSLSTETYVNSKLFDVSALGITKEDFKP